MEEVFDALDESASRAETLLENAAVGVVVCDVCGRYYISKGKDSNAYVALVPEDQNEP